MLPYCSCSNYFPRISLKSLQKQWGTCKVHFSVLSYVILQVFMLEICSSATFLSHPCRRRKNHIQNVKNIKQINKQNPTETQNHFYHKSLTPTMTKSVPILIFTGKTRGLWLGRVIGSVSPKQNSEKTSRWLTLTQPERRLLLLGPAYMIHLLPSPTVVQLNFIYLSPSFCAMPEIRPSF